MHTRSYKKFWYIKLRCIFKVFHLTLAAQASVAAIMEDVHLSFRHQSNMMPFVTSLYGTPKLSYVVIFLVALSKNCANLSMHYVIILKTRVVLSIYNVDMPTHCFIMLKKHFILSQRGVILSKKHVNLSI